MLEVRLGEWAGYGLSATWVLDEICISLCSHDMWNRSRLAAEVSLFSDDDIGTDLQTIRHVSHPKAFAVPPARMRMRVFSSPTGEPIQFEHHMEDKRNNKRMYYLADTERKVIVIGILCGHLETAKY